MSEHPDPITARAVGDGDPWRVALDVGSHRVVTDEPVGLGGGDSAPSPMQLWLASLAACTVTTLRMYAERKGWPLRSVRVAAHYPDDGQSGVERTIELDGDLDDGQRRRLLDIAARTPVTRVVTDAVEVRSRLA